MRVTKRMVMRMPHPTPTIAKRPLRIWDAGVGDGGVGRRVGGVKAVVVTSMIAAGDVALPERGRVRDGRRGRVTEEEAVVEEAQCR